MANPQLHLLDDDKTTTLVIYDAECCSTMRSKHQFLNAQSSILSLALNSVNVSIIIVDAKTQSFDRLLTVEHIDDGYALF